MFDVFDVFACLRFSLKVDFIINVSDVFDVFDVFRYLKKKLRTVFDVFSVSRIFLKKI